MNSLVFSAFSDELSRLLSPKSGMSKTASSRKCAGCSSDDADMAIDGKSYCQDCAPANWKQASLNQLFSDVPHQYREKARGGGVDSLDGFAANMNRLAGL